VQSASENLNPPDKPISGRELLLACLLLCGFSALLFLPAFIKGLPSGHDAYVHYRWAVQFNDALKEPGFFYPRWLSTANDNQGSPVMLYYPPLPFLVTAFFNFFTGDMVRAMTLACLLALLLSGVAMYLFCRSHFAPPVSLFAACLYLLAPYHLYDFYHRSALSEFWSFVWLPLILDAIQRIIGKQSWRMVVYLAASYALLLLTHVPISFAFSLALPLYILLLTRQWQALWRIAVGLMMGVGLSAVFVVPLLLERHFVKIQRVLGIRYTKYWVFEQLFATPFFHLPEQRRFFVMKMVDLTALALPFVLLLSAVVWFILRQQIKLTNEKKRWLVAAWVMAVLCLLLTTKVTAFIWEALPALAYLQFPFRWLTLVTLFVVALLAAMLSVMTQLRKAKWLVVALLTVIFLCLGMVSILVIKEAAHDREEIVKEVNAGEVREYRTIWQPGPRREAEEEEEAVAQTVATPLLAVIVMSGKAEVSSEDEEGMSQRYTVRATQETVLQFRALYFPGWQATVDNQPVEITAGEKGNIGVTVPAGEHQVELQFRDTRPRRIGKIISLLSLLLCLLLLWSKTLAQTDALRGFIKLVWNRRNAN